ncbi:hypothetical protein [Sphingobium indicum]|uniref:Uncharacterized protein n=1 Tax=Sphingobium indicum (strain DSM 16412 / CCM 7286 / MTCC 6364 / B90A) TaxID=861109 RepID=A0A1L5BMJ5_SPHIB|nr:hypothetical protein [Sphingobium indicum]APL94121.1 hypothetical protein SIDU_06145 [Sphingobium indicum B90A]
MADRPILFSTPMVRALLEGRKTQTRRICTGANDFGLSYVVALDDAPGWFGDEEGEVRFSAGFKPGDRLYVREEYYQFGSWHVVEGALTKGGKTKWAFDGAKAMVAYDPPADFLVSRDKAFPGLPRWYKRLGRFMPRSLSRMTLTVTDVRVERLHDISEDDAQAEGADKLVMDESGAFYAGFPEGTHKCGFAGIWSRINGAESWEANPWIVAVSFSVEKGNIDG